MIWTAPWSKTPHVGGFDIQKHDSGWRCDYTQSPVRSRLLRDIVFVNIDVAALDLNEYAANLSERFNEFSAVMDSATHQDCKWVVQVLWRYA